MSARNIDKALLIQAALKRKGWIRGDNDEGHLAAIRILIFDVLEIADRGQPEFFLSLDRSELQIVLCALGELSLLRPKFKVSAEAAAQKLNGLEAYKQFRDAASERVRTIARAREAAKK